MRYLILIFFLFGCSTKVTPIITYNLNLNLDINSYKLSKYKNKTIKVAYPTSIRGLITKRLRYSYNDLEDGVYNNARWSISSSKLLLNNFIKAIDKSDIFASVLDYTSLADTDYLLESEIYEFEHRVRGDSSLSVVTIKFNLIDMTNNKLVKSKKISHQAPTKTFDAKGYVEATNVALGRVVSDMLEWLDN